MGRKCAVYSGCGLISSIDNRPVRINMKKDTYSLSGILGELPLEVQTRTKLSLAIANRIENLMREKGYSKKQFAEALGRRPSEITKWLSGEHNFTIATLASLSAFFGEQIIAVSE